MRCVRHTGLPVLNEVQIRLIPLCIGNMLLCFMCTRCWSTSGTARCTYAPLSQGADCVLLALQDNLPGTDRHRHRNQDAGNNLKEAVPGTLNNQKATESTGEQIKRHIPGTEEHHAAYNEDMGDKVAKHIPGTDANKAAKVSLAHHPACLSDHSMMLGLLSVLNVLDTALYVHWPVSGCMLTAVVSSALQDRF